MGVIIGVWHTLEKINEIEFRQEETLANLGI